MAEETELEKSNKRLKKSHKEAEIVKAMDDAERHDDLLAFESKHRDLLEFWQTNYKDVTENSLVLASIGNARQKSDYAIQMLNKRRVRDTQYGLDNLESIVSDLGDKLKDVAVNFVPIKDTDLDSADDLDKLIEIYEENVDTLKDNLKNINQQTHPERYETQQKTIQECKEFKSLLKDYKDLVKEILDYKKVEVPFVGEKGRPDNAKMKELFDKYLDELAEKYKKKDIYDDNAPFIEAARALSNNPHYLTGYYAGGVLSPAKEKLNEKANKSNLKDYTKRNVRVMDSDKQMRFFDIVYAVSAQEEAKKQYRKAA